MVKTTKPQITISKHSKIRKIRGTKQPNINTQISNYSKIRKIRDQNNPTSTHKLATIRKFVKFVVKTT